MIVEESRKNRHDAEASAGGGSGDPTAGRSDLRYHLHLSDDRGVVIRSVGLSNGGDIHAEHASFSIGHQRGTGNVHDDSCCEYGQLRVG